MWAQHPTCATGCQVNPATVLEVLRGERPRSIPSRVRSVLLLLVSHGHAHPAGPGTSHHEWYMHLMLGIAWHFRSFPISRKEIIEWNCRSTRPYVEHCGTVPLFHMPLRPYPVPESDATLYDVVSHQGFHEVDPHPDWDWGAPKHRWRLYSQMLFQAL